MKLRLLYIIPFIALLATGCGKTNSGDLPTVPLPTGNFTGQFLRVRRSETTGLFDTAKANLNLSLSQSTGFAITGDTTTLHAGSYGSYAANAYYMQFADKTYSSTLPFKKYHLEGVYNYSYDGSKLEIYVDYADTLSLQYSFVKSN
jgi:hypothetical protein